VSRLARLIGTEPPQVPAGGRAYVAMDAPDGSAWSVRADMGDGGPGKRLGPSFTSQVVAYDWLDYVTGVSPSF
jgi:hypothetical protein